MKVRYKQTVIGAAWAVLQPLLTMLVFTLFFGHLAKISSDGIPYSLFTLAGLIPWTLFANGLSQSANSLVANPNLITKVYFPRLTIPVSAVLSGTIDFLVGLLLLSGAMLYYGYPPRPVILLLPLFVALAVAASLGAGIWLAALNVEYRDVRYVVPFLTQLWMLATPIAYPSSLVPSAWRVAYGLNPMVGVVDGFRWVLFAGAPPPVSTVIASMGAAAFLLISGGIYFRQMEKNFADLV
ncbi:MAG: ABC transporter permease [Acidobacteriota bacterium]|nr:ABC transporter permease [Acidobacteriota bacterium]